MTQQLAASLHPSSYTAPLTQEPKAVPSVQEGGDPHAQARSSLRSYFLGGSGCLRSWSNIQAPVAGTPVSVALIRRHLVTSSQVTQSSFFMQPLPDQVGNCCSLGCRHHWVRRRRSLSCHPAAPPAWKVQQPHWWAAAGPHQPFQPGSLTTPPTSDSSTQTPLRPH